MAVRAFSADPDKLVKLIRDKIASGSIRAWSLDEDGDLTHTAEQWKGKAWMRPRISDDRVTFSILGNVKMPMTKSTYGVYHGRLVEMLITHFDNYLTRATATANAVQGDIIKNFSDDENN